MPGGAKDVRGELRPPRTARPCARLSGCAGIRGVGDLIRADKDFFDFGDKAGKGRPLF